MKKSRIVRSRLALRDKNASVRTHEHPLPLEAKARLVVAGQDDPDAFSGLSEILNMDFPPEYMGLVARAKSSALLECTIPMTAYEVDQLVRGLCSFARQMLQFRALFL